MKTVCRLIILAMVLCSSPLLAEYCETDETGKVTSCVYKIPRAAKDVQMVISYTQQGWSLMTVMILDEWVMLEGDASVKIDGEEYALEYVNTRRDVTASDRVMEAAIYSVDEALLQQLADAGGKVRFYLAASDAEDQEVVVWSGRFSKLDDYVAETKARLGL